MERPQHCRVSKTVLLALLAVLVACSEHELVQDERPATASVQLAPFHQDVALPSARHARPWKPPEAGPVPVVEVLRDGTWIVDGTLVRQDTADALVTLRKLLYEQARRMPQVPLFEEGKPPTIPGNPLFLRIDREAPWSRVRPIIESCAMQGIYLFDIDIQVASDGRDLRVLRLAIPRVMGMNVCYSGFPRLRSLTLEAGTLLRTEDGTAAALPVDLELRGLEFLPEEAPRIDTRFRDAREFVQKLREIADNIGSVDIRLPDSAPAWVGVLAVDLAVEAGVRFAEVLMESPDQTEER
jgi:hypothetical protein